MYLNLNLCAWRRLIYPADISWSHQVKTGLLAAVNSSLQGLAPAPHLDARSAPVFLIGHWRSGTTLLHELLSLDLRHTVPNTYQCLNPSHFLLTEAQFLRSDGARTTQMMRPMDQVTISMQSPQEDEFALLCLGAISPYQWMLLPQAYQSMLRALRPQQWSPNEQAHWQQIVAWFLGGVAQRRPGRLLLKSPTHTFRVQLLARMFPDAQFVHIVRNPDHVFLSTQRMWASMFKLYALQAADLGRLPSQVLEIGHVMEQALDEALPSLPPQRYFRLRYEDLVARPEAQLAGLYEHFKWPDIQSLMPRVQTYLTQRRDYAARSEMPPSDQLSRLRQGWQGMYEKYGY